MTKLLRVVAACFALLLVASPALAQAPVAEVTAEERARTDTAVQAAVENATRPFIDFSAAFGAGLIIIGAGMGIGRIGSHAVESMARQPEVANNIQTAMLIAAALIEGATFFGLIVCLLQIYG